jgi:hypothetical protein
MLEVVVLLKKMTVQGQDSGTETARFLHLSFRVPHFVTLTVNSPRWSHSILLWHKVRVCELQGGAAVRK